MSPTNNSTEHVELVCKAQLGCQESMNRLVELTQKSVFAYIYRLTMDHDLAEDLQQETMLEMVKSLKQIREPERFWGWLYRTALGKVQHYYRKLKREREAKAAIAEDKEHLLQAISSKYDDGLMTLVNKELSQGVVDAISKLDLKYRNILVLRCYQQLSYAEISEIMGISEMTARVLFYRAKAKLKRGLSKRGFGSGVLLAALGLFGTMTSPADAKAVTVTADVVKVGAGGTIIGVATSKLGATIATVITAAAVSVGTVAMQSGGDDLYGGRIPDRSEIKSFHHIQQAWDKTNSPNPNLMRGRSLSKGAYEQWHYFPEGVDGPMFFAMQRWNPKRTEKLCSWTQDSSGNYYYQSGMKRVFIRNHNLPMRYLNTRRLPTDTVEFTEFLDDVEGKNLGIDYTRDPKTGLLTGVLDDRFFNAHEFKDTISYNKFGEEVFGQFRHSWVEDVSAVDERDQMHQRGFTYVRIEGEINGKLVKGKARIPFVYDALAEHWPWLVLQIGDDLKIVDRPSGSYMTNAAGKVLASYEQGSFFKGLARPWFGMNAVDIVRRDAAEKRVGFNIENYDYDDEHYGKAKIEMSGKAQMVYVIDIDKDILEEVEFTEDGQRNYIRFTHYQDIEGMDPEFTVPKDVRLPKRTRRESVGMLWLMELSQGSLGK